MEKSDILQQKEEKRDGASSCTSAALLGNRRTGLCGYLGCVASMHGDGVG